MHPLIKGKLFAELTWIPKDPTGTNAYGQPILGVPVVGVPCYVWHKEKTFYTKEGVQYTSTVQYIVDFTLYPIKAGDYIQVDDRKMVVRGVEKYHNPFNRDDVSGIVAI